MGSSCSNISAEPLALNSTSSTNSTNNGKLLSNGTSKEPSTESAHFKSSHRRHSLIGNYLKPTQVNGLNGQDKAKKAASKHTPLMRAYSQKSVSFRKDAELIDLSDAESTSSSAPTIPAFPDAQTNGNDSSSDHKRMRLKKRSPSPFVTQKMEGSSHSPPMRPPDSSLRARPRRGGVSAEVYSEDEIKSYKKKIIPKDDPARKSLEAVMKSNVLFAHMEENEKVDIFDAMFPVEVYSNDTIISQGDHGDNFYVIDSGTCDVYVNEQHVTSITNGGSFGELALIYGTPRAATVKAATATKLWALDRETYRKVVMASQINKRKTYQDFLAKVDILSDLDEWERSTVADALENVTFEPETTVMSQGEPGFEFYIIIEGEAEVLQCPPGKNKPEVVGKLGPSEYFGEVALIMDRPRAASVVAKSKLKCAQMDRDRFERVMGPASDIMKRNIDKYQSYVDLK